MKDTDKTKNSHRNREYAIRRRAILKKVHVERMPIWANTDMIVAIYRAARDLRDAGLDVDVEHWIPLHSEIVSGLHVENNLAIIQRADNNKRGNYYDPNN